MASKKKPPPAALAADWAALKKAFPKRSRKKPVDYPEDLVEDWAVTANLPKYGYAIEFGGEHGFALHRLRLLGRRGKDPVHPVEYFVEYDQMLYKEPGWKRTHKSPPMGRYWYPKRELSFNRLQIKRKIADHKASYTNILVQELRRLRDTMAQTQQAIEFLTALAQNLQGDVFASHTIAKVPKEIER